MLAGKKECITAYAISIFVMVVCILGIAFGWDTASVGISKHSPWVNRLLYHFAHAGIIHCLINSWCLVSIGTSFRVPLSYYLCAYVLSALCPCSFLGTIPTIGMSGICFALLGMVSWQARIVRFHIWMALFIGIGYLTTLLLHRPLYNNLLHIYCYLAGVAVGFLDSPAPWQRR